MENCTVTKKLRSFPVSGKVFNVIDGIISKDSKYNTESLCHVFFEPAKRMDYIFLTMISDAQTLLIWVLFNANASNRARLSGWTKVKVF